ncbi:hypothetical protein G9A89_003906 [Geosiphon pyriformis]|nr:hypothetical protein G9A89_003906 [Geosiphon pyriformis]
MCGHFKPIAMPSTPLIEFEEEKVKPIWEAYQVFEMLPILDWEEKSKEKGKGREENIPKETTTAEEITSDWKREYSHEPIKELPYIPLKCKNCGKKLSSMEA